MYIDRDQNLCYKIFGCACSALNYMNSLVKVQGESLVSPEKEV